VSPVSNHLKHAIALLVAVAVLLLAAAPALGQQSQMLDPRVANALLEAYEKIEEDDPQGALRDLNKLMADRGEDMKPFDRATVLQIRGTAYINLENIDAALEDYSEALRLNALPVEQQNRLRFNLAQLYFVTEQYERSLEFFEDWMALEDVEITHTTYFMVAAAHYNLEDYREALEPISQAIETSPEPERRYYEVKNAVLNNLEMVPERTDLLEEMVSIWTDNLTFWRQLSALYSEQQEQYKAFSAIETAYLNGLTTEERDIVLLAQYYSSFSNPHRGAKLLERHMQAGDVEESVDHLKLLSQLWSQAREHEKSIPVLRQAARLAEDGELYFRLGQSLMANEDNEGAEAAFVNALDRGGLDEDTRADSWLLLGNARFNQAGPGDREQRMLAAEAFENAQRFDRTRREANEWRNYISAINQTERRQAQLEREQQARMAESARERQITACRARQLAGSSLSQECQELLAEVNAQQDEPEPEAEDEDSEQDQ
jgi:tetratricopeptide (TPR) repeat protein